jgi:pimeloyl-ACP methyl ester carboxylesterase
VESVESAESVESVEQGERRAPGGRDGYGRSVRDTQVTTLPDDRELAWLETGRARGMPVFMFHGTPGTRLQVSFDHKAIGASGVRLLAPDRPGYGHSSFHPGRTLGDWATDVATLADHLKIERFAVVGVSGGGPHAAACARFLPERVTAAALVSGVGPMDDPEFDVGMVGFNKAAVAMAAHVPFLLSGLFAVQGVFMRRRPDAALRAVSRMLPDPDVRLLERPDVRAAFLQDLSQPSGTTARATAQDFVLFARDWGFRLQDIAVPVHVWHGDLDRNVPFAQGTFVAEHIPGAELHACPGEGHLLGVAHLEEILRTVGAGS